jgi:hypothetical protein
MTVGREPKSFAGSTAGSRASPRGSKAAGQLGASVNVRFTGSSGSEADSRVVYSWLMWNFRSRPEAAKLDPVRPSRGWDALCGSETHGGPRPGHGRCIRAKSIDYPVRMYGTVLAT